MKTIYLLQLCALAVGISSPVFAQKDAEPTPHKWAPTDIINIHDSVAVFRISYGKDKDGMAVIDKNGVAVGEDLPLPPNTFGIARFGDGLLAFYQPEKKSESREVHAILINLKNKTAGQDKIVFSVPTEYNIDFVVERDGDGIFQGLLARITGYKSKKQIVPLSSNKENREYNTTSGLSITTLSPSLEPNMVLLSSAITTGSYVTSAMNRAGELFVISNGSGQLIAEKFSATGALENKLSVDFLPRDNSFMTFVGHLDPTHDNAITIAAKYRKEDKKEAESAYRFDFDANLAYAAKEDILDKYYYRALKADTGQTTKIHSSNVRNIESLVPVSIVEIGDVIAICKEIEYETVTTSGFGSSASSTVHYWCDAAILSVYDKQMNLLRSITLDKSMETFVPSYPGINIHLDGNKLYAVTAELAGIASLAEYAYTIDITNGGIDKKRLRKGSWGKAATTKPLYTFWLKDTFVANYVTHGFTGKEKTSFLPAEYE
jgi:hypothetical protein